MANRKKPTIKELNAEVMLNRQAMVNIDNFHRHTGQEILALLTHYIDFNKDRKKFEKYIDLKLKEAKKEVIFKNLQLRFMQAAQLQGAAMGMSPEQMEQENPMPPMPEGGAPMMPGVQDPTGAGGGNIGIGQSPIPGEQGFSGNVAGGAGPQISG